MLRCIGVYGYHLYSHLCFFLIKSLPPEHINDSIGIRGEQSFTHSFLNPPLFHQSLLYVQVAMILMYVCVSKPETQSDLDQMTKTRRNINISSFYPGVIEITEQNLA